MAKGDVWAEAGDDAGVRIRERYAKDGKPVLWHGIRRADRSRSSSAPEKARALAVGVRAGLNATETTDG
jgi:hypothetical protein